VLWKNVRLQKLLDYRTDIDELCEMADCFIHTAFQEGLSVALLEAMASGLPVIGSDVRGARDLVVHGKGGICVRPKSVAEVKNAIQRMYSDKNLIVVISTDKFNWNEKHKKCYFTYEQRKALMEAVRYVDLVIPEESWSQKRNDMHEYHIDTFVMGDDWTGKFDFLREEGVEVVYIPHTLEISSSQIRKDLYDANAVDAENQISHSDINTNP